MHAQPERCLDAAVACRAEQQHGLITLEQLRDLGVTRSAIRTRLRRGQWTSVEPTVLRIAGSPVTWESRVMAAVLGAGGAAAASHRAAVALWGLPGFDDTAPEVTVPRGRNFRRRGVVVHRSADLHLITPDRRYGVPVTPVGRTLLDLGAVVSRSRVQAAVDGARRQGLIDWDGLLDTLVTHARRGRDGVATLRAVVDRHLDQVVRLPGGFERLVFVLLRNVNLPPAVLDHELHLDGGPVRLGLAFPARKLAVELARGDGHDDGGDDHRGDQQPRDQHARDGDDGRSRAVDRALAAAGWSVLRLRKDTYLDRPGEAVRRVRDALAGAPVAGSPDEVRPRSPDRPPPGSPGQGGSAPLAR